MPSQVEDLLIEMPGDLSKIKGMYECDVASHALSRDLRRAIRYLVHDLRSALDWTATDLDRKFGKGVDPSPYFPIWTVPARFQKSAAKHFPTLPQNVLDALERHQPFAGRPVQLSYLPRLSRVNGHQDFTEQTRTETQRWRQETGGGVVEWGEGVSWGPGVFVGDRPMGDPQTTTLTVFVGWNFVDPAVPVLPTLEELVRLVTEAVHAIRHEAAL